jgi:hypothetical protein
MNSVIFKEVYASHEVVRAICDLLSQRMRNQNETPLHTIMKHLEKAEYDYKKSEIIDGFRQLEHAECGTYVEGRHGWKSRFIWSVKTLNISRYANSDSTQSTEQVSDIEVNDSLEKEYDEDLIEHQFILRPDLTVSIELPENLTTHEAKRISMFVKSLSFEE